ncbi:hypothetical protein Dimus_000139 [Dionaea muscipula]
MANVFIASALIDMYANCGGVEEARLVFDQTVRRNSVLWTSMVSGYLHSGRGLEGLELFDRLEMEEELVLDHICFTAILGACNHAGFLDRGVEYFEKMKKDYGLVPKLDHYACLVDLYATKGYLKEAKRIMEEMPFAPNDVLLSSFLSSCKMYGVIELARETFNKFFKMQPYVVMMHIYAEAGLWDEVAEIKKSMKQQEISKVVGWSWVEVNDQVGEDMLAGSLLKQEYVWSTFKFYVDVCYHHGGLWLKDRNLVENLFLCGDIQVLCTTNTLVQGINLPA